MLYALLSPAGEILDYRTFTVEPEGLAVAPSKPRLVPVVDHEPPAFNAVTEVLEGPAISVAADEVVWAWTVRPHTSGELTSLRAGKAAQVKAEAAARILTLFPDWKQRNMTARGVELLAILQERPWTIEEAEESDALKAAWGVVTEIRTASNLIEAAIPNDAAGIAAFDVMAGWA